MTDLNDAGDLLKKLTNKTHSHKLFEYSHIVSEKKKATKDLKETSPDSQLDHLSHLLVEQEKHVSDIVDKCHKIERIIRVLENEKEFSITKHNDYKHVLKIFHELVKKKIGLSILHKQMSALRDKNVKEYLSLYKKERELFHHFLKLLKKTDYKKLGKHTKSVLKEKSESTNLSVAWLPLTATFTAFFIMTALTGRARRAYLHDYNVDLTIRKIETIILSIKNF